MPDHAGYYGVRLAGQPIVVFRTPAGVGALTDVCPHRRMRLSAGGRVCGDRLQCAYHGWTFDACGRGESPGTPKLYACADSFEAREAHGAVWVRARGAASEFPTFEADGYLPAAFKRRQRRTGAPWVAIAACAGAWALALPLGFDHLVALDIILYGLSLLLEFEATATK